MIPKEIEDVIKNGARLAQQFAYIPKRLEVGGREELKNFPLNILFVSHKTDGILVITAESFYLPELGTFRVDLGAQRLDYLNKYNPGDRVVITYHADTGAYEGEKFISGESVLTAYGDNWQNLFIHLGMNGLSDGEGCLISQRQTGKV